MSTESHMQAIATKRSTIKNAIHEEMNHPHPNFDQITKLKKQNMKLKEEMMRTSIQQKSASTG